MKATCLTDNEIHQLPLNDDDFPHRLPVEVRPNFFGRARSRLHLLRRRVGGQFEGLPKLAVNLDRHDDRLRSAWAPPVVGVPRPLAAWTSTRR